MPWGAAIWTDQQTAPSPAGPEPLPYRLYPSHAVAIGPTSRMHAAAV